MGYCRNSKQTTGIVSEIQRSSLHDGPGIRTTVFLKGCNLRCGWCHNPETLSPNPKLRTFPDKCIGCGACLAACPRGAHTTSPEGKRLFRRELCVACGRCARTCYAEALVVVGREMTGPEVLREVLEDRDFYGSSGGGVTLSGGEPLLQWEFAREVLRLCKEQGIHAAIQSNMAWPWERVEALLPLLDLVMMDIKLMDEVAHREWTGASNEVILDNAIRLGQQDVRLVVRTPVVPGVTDGTEQIAQIAEFVARLPNLDYYELLPYHPLGEDKYRSLGLECRTTGLKGPNRKRIQELVAVARETGVRVRPQADACALSFLS